MMLFDAMDLGATFVFAISGATRSVRHRLDLFGVLVVAWRPWRAASPAIC